MTKISSAVEYGRLARAHFKRASQNIVAQDEAITKASMVSGIPEDVVRKLVLQKLAGSK